MPGQQRGKSKASRRCTALVKRAALLVGVLAAVCLLGTHLTRNHSVLHDYSPEESAGPTVWQQIAARSKLRLKILQHHSRKTEGAAREIPEQQRPVTYASEAIVAAALRSWKSRAPHQATADPACAAFWNRNLSSVAVVGNGPITSRQREEIGTHDMVVRFNFLNNMWRDSEQIDVWAVRYSFDAAHRFWGFGQMTTEQASEVLQKTQSVWLIGGKETTWAADELVQDLPEVAEHQPVYISQDAFFRGEGSKAAAGMSEFADAPSTGFIGLSMVLACTQPPTRLHVYGMNWTQKMWSGHNVHMEAMLIHKLEQQGRIKVHLAPCANMRTCETAELDSDCHYDQQRRFVCPRPSPQLAGDGLQGPLPLEQREFATVGDVLLDAADGTQDAYLGNLAGNVRPFRLADAASYLRQQTAERQGLDKPSQKGPRLQATTEAFAAE